MGAAEELGSERNGALGKVEPSPNQAHRLEAVSSLMASSSLASKAALPSPTESLWKSATASSLAPPLYNRGEGRVSGGHRARSGARCRIQSPSVGPRLVNSKGPGQSTPPENFGELEHTYYGDCAQSPLLTIHQCRSNGPFKPPFSGEALEGCTPSRAGRLAPSASAPSTSLITGLG